MSVAATRTRPARNDASGSLPSRVVPLAAGLVVLAAILWLAQGAAWAQERVGVEASDANGHGRIILAFDRDLPRYDIRTSTGVLVIGFREPVDIDVGRIHMRIGDYVAAARRDPDGLAVRFALARRVSVNTIEAGEKLFVDLLPEGWVGLPPSLPPEVVEELSRRAQAAELARADRERLARLRNAGPVELRIARLPTFTRFVFSWGEPVDAQLARDLDKVRLSFAEFGLFDGRGRLSELPDHVFDIVGENGAQGLEIELSVDPESTVRGFQEDNTYVVDVTTPGVKEVLAGPPLPETPGTAGNATRIEGAVAYETAMDEDTARSAASAGFVVETLMPLDGGEAEMASAAEGQPGPAGDVVLDDLTLDTIEDSIDAVRAEARRLGSSVRVVFPFPEETASAVFERAGSLWLIFDTSHPVDLRALRYDLGDLISRVELSRLPDHTIVRVVLVDAMLSTVATEGTSWVVTIGSSVLATPTALDLVRRAGADEAPEVAIDFPGAASVRSMRDPDSGERIVAVTGQAPARSVVKQQNFVDFSALPSIHGVVLRPTADDLAIEVEDDTVVLGRDGGLVISEVAGLVGYRPGRSRIEDVVRPGFVDVSTEFGQDEGAVYDLISEHLRNASEADDDRRTQARMRLARAMLATDLGAEALGQLELIARQDPAILREPSARALRGIANTLMHRPDEAIREFDAYGLSKSTDVSLWRGVAEAQRGEWQAAIRALSAGAPALPSYSVGRQRLFETVSARAAIETRDTALAAEKLAVLEELGLSDDPRLLLLQGRLAESLGDRENAIRAYDAVLREKDAMASAEARLRRTLLSHELGLIPEEEAIEELETLAIVWRGDEIEYTTLRHLAVLQVAAGNHRRGFELMKSASVADPRSPVVRGLQDDMNQAFEALFLGGKAEELPPVEALALYYDFRELTPIGPKGDEMIRGLAERLVDVDLLDHATELLAHQVEHRLSGAARAQVAGRLAMVHLMNRKPAEALNVIARTRQAVLPQAVQRQRTLIEARAQAETGRSDLALDLLSALGDSPEIAHLRADTLWLGEHWQEAAEGYEKLLSAGPDGSVGLDDASRQYVLRSAIAYALADDALGLARLRARFLSRMSDSPDAHAFGVVTLGEPVTSGEFRAVVESVAAMDTLDAFLEEYRSRYDSAATVPAEQQPRT